MISRVLLQQKLAEAARRYGGEKIIQNDCHVVDFDEVLHLPCLSAQFMLNT